MLFLRPRVVRLRRGGKILSEYHKSKRKSASESRAMICEIYLEQGKNDRETEEFGKFQLGQIFQDSLSVVGGQTTEGSSACRTIPSLQEPGSLKAQHVDRKDISHKPW